MSQSPSDHPVRRTLPREGAAGRAVHDVGGLDFGPVDRHEHDLALWEKRTDAMLILLVGTRKNAFTVDGLRRVIEDYGQQEYDATTYYQKWIRAIRNLVVEQELVSRAEVEARVAKLAAEVEAAGRPVSRKPIPW